MVRNCLGVACTIVWLLALAYGFGAGLSIPLSNQIAKLMKFRFTLLAPFPFLLIAFAAFQSRQSPCDLAALLDLGALGILLRRFEHSRSAFLIGLALSNQSEILINQALQIASSRFWRAIEAGLDYIFSPLTLGLLLRTVVSIVVAIRASKKIREKIDTHAGTTRAQAVSLACVTAYIVVAVIDSAMISRTGDMVFPLAIGLVTLAGCIALLARMARRPASDEVFVDPEAGDEVFVDPEAGDEDSDAPHGQWRALGRFLLLLILRGLFGFILAAAIFLVAFFRPCGRRGWPAASLDAAARAAFILFLVWVLGRDFPPGLLRSSSDFAWPFN